MNGKVSVLMGIYNCESTLVQAISSIQHQTYTNWELILCDDGSKDNTYQVAKQMATEDDRIIVIKNEKNLGLNATLNKCLAIATGEYIARMDGDDESLPERFQRQIDFLESQEEYDIVSSSMILFDENGEWGRKHVKKHPEAEDLVTGNPICHAPVMMRKKCMDDVKGYTVDKKMIRVEDVNLWIKLYAAGYRCYNMEEPLYRMRNDKNALARRKYKYRINSAYVRIQGCRLLNLGIKYYIKACMPMIIGLVPAKLRSIYRRQQQKKRNYG